MSFRGADLVAFRHRARLAVSPFAVYMQIIMNSSHPTRPKKANERICQNDKTIPFKVFRDQHDAVIVSVNKPISYSFFMDDLQLN